MPSHKLPAPPSREDLVTRWAFNFFMGSVGLAILLAVVYVLTLSL